MQKYPFEASIEDILKDPEPYIDAVFSCLLSEFLVMPKGLGFVEYPVFECGYEALKAATAGFSRLDPERVFKITVSEPISIVVLRSMLGFTPPEWGYVTTQRTGSLLLKDLCARWTGKFGWILKRNSTQTALQKNGSKQWSKSHAS